MCSQKFLTGKPYTIYPPDLRYGIVHFIIYKPLKDQHTVKTEAHDDWVSTVRFSPSSQNPVIVSASWDKVVKVFLSFYELKLVILQFFQFQVWNLATCRLKTNHIGHSGYINTVTISPDGSLCASGGKV